VPQLIWSPEALADVQRLYRSLVEKTLMLPDVRQVLFVRGYRSLRTIWGGLSCAMSSPIASRSASAAAVNSTIIPQRDPGSPYLLSRSAKSSPAGSVRPAFASAIPLKSAGYDAAAHLRAGGWTSVNQLEVSGDGRAQCLGKTRGRNSVFKIQCRGASSR